MTGLPCSTVIDEDLTLARIKVSPTSRDGRAHLRSRSGSTVAGENWTLARITVSPTSRDSRAHLRSRSGSMVAGGNWMLARITVSPTSRDSTSHPTTVHTIWRHTQPNDGRTVLDARRDHRLTNRPRSRTCSQTVHALPSALTHGLFVRRSAVVRRPSHCDALSDRRPSLYSRHDRATASNALHSVAGHDVVDVFRIDLLLRWPPAIRASQLHAIELEPVFVGSFLRRV